MLPRDTARRRQQHLINIRNSQTPSVQIEGLEVPRPPATLLLPPLIKISNGTRLADVIIFHHLSPGRVCVWLRAGACECESSVKPPASNLAPPCSPAGRSYTRRNRRETRIIQWRCGGTYCAFQAKKKGLRRFPNHVFTPTSTENS